MGETQRMARQVFRITSSRLFDNTNFILVHVTYAEYGPASIVLVSLFYREQRQKEATKTAIVNSFPKDRDYRREAMQASTTPGFTAASK